MVERTLHPAHLLAAVLPGQNDRLGAEILPDHPPGALAALAVAARHVAARAAAGAATAPWVAGLRRGFGAALPLGWSLALLAGAGPSGLSRSSCAALPLGWSFALLAGAGPASGPHPGER